MKEISIGKAIHQIENLFLLLIAVLTVAGAVKEVYLILNKRDVGLQDLLLMFLYVEVLGMVGAYYESKKIPISLPIFIAITALARLLILQKEQDPLNLIYEASAILILAIASVVVNLRFWSPGAGLTADKEHSTRTGERSLKL
jgi:protein PsiE